MPFLKRAKKPEPQNATAVGGAPQWPIGGMRVLEDWWAAQANVWTGTTWLDEQAALGVPSVSAALSLLAAYVTQMPLQAVKEDSVPPTVVEPTPLILRGPLGDPRVTNITFADWIEAVLRDLALYGNYLAVLGDVTWDGWPNIMFGVMAGDWSVEWRNGRRIYHIGSDEYDPSEIFHVAINRRTGELVGRGLLNTNRDTLASAIASERWAARYFTTGTVPSVHISHPNPDLTQDQANDLKAKFLESATGTRAPVVTPAGTDITVLPSDAESAQLVEARRWANASLAMALGVQPAMLGLEGPSMTYRNIAEVNQQTINTTVMRYLVPIEQQMTAQCLPRGVRARFATAALVRPDMSERIQQALTAYTGGLVSLNEARAMLDLAPKDDLEPVNNDVTTPSTQPDVQQPPTPLAIVGSAE